MAYRIRGVTDVTTMYRQGPWQMDHVMEHADTAGRELYMIFTAIPMTRNYISRSTQHYDTAEEAMRVETEVRQGSNLPADEQYTMVRRPDHRMNPNAFI